MVNVNKLKGKIVEKELSIEKVARQMGLHPATLYRRINQDKGTTFTIGEALAIVEILDLTPQEATAIFFSQHVA
jgi:AraC-like DNA-binding protein